MWMPTPSQRPLLGRPRPRAHVAAIVSAWNDAAVVAILVDVVAPGKHALSRLKKELVIWLETTGRDRRPQAVPVWFLWDGKSFLIYAVPGFNDWHGKASAQLSFPIRSSEV